MDEPRRIQFCKVLNKNSFAIIDRYDGVPYTFGAGKTETIPLEAAQHIFGWRDDGDEQGMYHYIVQRHGWNTHRVKEEDARNYVANIVLTPVSARLVMEPPDAVLSERPEPETIPVKPGTGAKSLASLSASAAKGLAPARAAAAGSE